MAKGGVIIPVWGVTVPDPGPGALGGTVCADPAGGGGFQLCVSKFRCLRMQRNLQDTHILLSFPVQFL